MARHWDDRYADEEEDDYEEPELNLGPDERDMDLLDGTYEARYYSGHRQRDWSLVQVGVGLILLVAIIGPGLMVLFQ